MEFEMVLQRRPDDVEVQAALKEIESRATNAGMPATDGEPVAVKLATNDGGENFARNVRGDRRRTEGELENFVDSRLVPRRLF